jgi:MOSC domain-containing protein YiiM
MARAVSVNVGGVRTVQWHGRTVTTGIWKSPVDGRVPVRGVNLAGDDQADRRVHGGPDKAVYAYALEDYAWWSGELGREIGPATFGENLTVEGLHLGALEIGTRWLVGSTELEVSQPRKPCFKLGIRMDDAQFVDRFDDAARFGAYLRIVREGDVGAGDDVRVLPRADGVTDAITVEQLGRVTGDADVELLERIASDGAVAEGWRDWATRQLARR